MKRSVIHKVSKICFALGILIASAEQPGRAQNPIIRDQFSADPSARVFGDSVYLYPSHDIPVVNGNGRPGWFCMQDYHVFSSAGLMDWTDHGVIVSQEKVPWADPSAYSMWAPDCIAANGKYYFYFPTKAKDTIFGKGFSIGVAVGDRPSGPFIPQAQPIAGVHGIDPNVFVDTNGQAYLYWAEGKIYVAKLKENMLELASEPKVLSELPEKGLKEGPYLFERKGIYYLTYPHVQNKTERLEYATSNNPTGPFRFGGVIMDESPTGCWTNHQSIISYKGQWYLFYHHNDLSPGFDKNRSVRIDSLFFEPDGAIRKVIPTLRGVGITKATRQIQIDRYSHISDKGAGIAFLDTLDRFKGWKTIFEKEGGWVEYDGVDFGTDGSDAIVVKAASKTGGMLEIRMDGMGSPVVARVTVPKGETWTLVKTPLSRPVTGVHNLVVKMATNARVEVDWISFGAQNPILFADVPDMSMLRVGDTYYMSSTTMHMSPGLPIMRSKDLVNWELVSYAYDTLADMDELDLKNGKSTYGRGSWASSLRYHDGTFYVSTFAQTTGKTYVYATRNIEKGPWKAASFKPAYHDHSLFFDDDGRVYLITGAGKLRLIELNADASGIKPDGVNEVVIENASTPSGTNGGLPAEGSQLFKINGKYYLFNITWPKGGMRTVIIHRADKITGPYEGRVALQDMGVAQGGLIQATDSSWYAYLFRDYGAVGRIPYLVPVKWVDGWPVLGTNTKVPETLDLPANRGLIPGIVASDEFSRRKGEPALPLVWQWNHNPDNNLWSVSERKGYLRLRTGRTDTSFVLARNTLTQRTIGPACSGTTSVDISGMKDGDFAGLALLQKKYGLVGVKVEGKVRSVVMVSAESGTALDIQSVPLTGSKVYLKAECDFTDKKDMAEFYYSLDGKKWLSIGQPLHMAYTIPHFMGYRFGLFNYATKTAGGYADFDFFHITDQTASQPAITLRLDQPGHAVSPKLYGLMTEEINFSYDGGLYGELIRNRAFRNNPMTPENWSLVEDGGAKGAASLDRQNPVNQALPVSLRLEAHQVGDRIGIANEGYWGIPVRPKTAYSVSFYAKSTVSAALTVSIESKDGKTIYARAQSTAIGSGWQQYQLALTTADGITPTADARFVIAAKDTGTYWFNLVSLFPPTYNRTPNGNREDIMKLLADMKPAFLRFPGGNYLEGDYFSSRFDWKKTIGPLDQRPGHPGPWGYRSTDGMGLYEFLMWCEDLKMEPLLAVFAGYTLKGDYFDDPRFLQPFIDEALEEIEYVMGDKSTKWGAMRARDGHPAPFPLTYVEIGNEDGFDRSGSYGQRFDLFAAAIRARYPQLKIISTVGGKNDWLSARHPLPQTNPDLVDEHFYRSSIEMQEMATMYDHYDRNGPKVFVGEWASREGFPTTNLNAALGDAAFLTGLERNSDLVIMSCYAPLFVNVNPGGMQWKSDLIGYNTLSSFGSPSYYVQKMFGNNTGDLTVPIETHNLPTQVKKPNARDSARGAQAVTIPAMFFSATRDSKTRKLFLKVVNASPAAQNISIDLSGNEKITPEGTAVTLWSDSPENTNSITEPNKIVPATQPVKGLGKNFRQSFPPWSVTVLQLQLR